jgi:hypothetical protein
MVASTGWTLINNTDGSAQDGTCCAYKLCGVGESTSQVPFGASSQGMCACWEVSGLTGVWATDFQSTHNNFDLTMANAYITGSYNTVSPNTMVLTLHAGTIATGSTAVAPAVTTGQTDDKTLLDNTSSSRHGGMTASHQLFPASGSAVAYTVTEAVPYLKGMWVHVALNWPAPAAAGVIRSIAPSGI